MNKVLYMDELPRTGRNPELCLKQVIAQIEDLTPATCLLLPSLQSLAMFFDVKEFELMDTLHAMRKEGYDNFVPGLYGHITMWRQSPEYCAE
jgi:hypothetical protein